MTTEITSPLPPCPLPDCMGVEHHWHDIAVYAVTETHDCAKTARRGYRCYGPSIPQWQPIEPDQIRAGMRIRATIQCEDRTTVHVGVAHHQDVGTKIWYTEDSWPLAGWGSPTTYEVDPTTTDPGPSGQSEPDKHGEGSALHPDVLAIAKASGVTRPRDLRRPSRGFPVQTRFVSAKRYVPLAQAAEYLGVSEKTCRRMISSGELPAYRLRNKLLRIDLNELDALMRPVPTASLA